MSTTALPQTRAEWQAALASLPSSPARIPAFFFAHGSPMLATSSTRSRFGTDSIMAHMGPSGPLAQFLSDFGPTLLDKYRPRGILVFSAHWETAGERLVTDYGDSNPLLMDYYGFDRELYELQFRSRGDKVLAQRIVQCFKDVGQLARTTGKLEPRGEDGRGFQGPGLDHGVFVPFRIMFGEVFMDVPIVQVSIDASLSPEKNWAVGAAVSKLREEGILVLSGGLTIHNLRDFSSFSPANATKPYKDFHQAVLDALTSPSTDALLSLPRHPSFRLAHPRAEHFVPIYVAAGAGLGDKDKPMEGRVKVLSAVYGAVTAAFDV
ncbi:Extradiol aromatic ring-opening dioxygenase [Gloeophyllum trabeum ATCC 11539]|uniref:Extradiol aromatic ring-opening dioxygenase n=1 Tax=Gloeophyllum trabeum (strain ATCC 11539 / FP-39264 / Madison 617) TaxID=670483 RepID=S7QFW9_GLOTA|nr:Extradiol aromatic ring-opening dioxygenase [Gloeophyllum trabeum ATCC 11539]EPQ58048.1 Extradiol aromatic ring-opening dioxygenase [Gloeophyllum trabeum ATCC 11539]